MSPEQLICTIEEVNVHDSDSRDDPWQRANEQWADLAASFKSHYQSIAGETGPDQSEVAEALQTLGKAAQRVTDSMSKALKDPDSREQVKSVAAGFLTAIGRTLSDLGNEFAQRPDAPVNEDSSDS